MQHLYISLACGIDLFSIKAAPTSLLYLGGRSDLSLLAKDDLAKKGTI